MKHMTKKFGLNVTIVTVLATALSATGIPARADSTTLTEKEEIEVGRHMAERAQMMYGKVLPAGDPLSVRVRRIGNAIAKLSGRRRIPYTYKVLDNNQLMNAFSVGGGPIFITKKLVTMASNDAELAYVLGHETGHIDRKHMVDTIEKHRQAARWAEFLGQTFGRGGGDFMRLATYVTYSLWSLGYSRNQETEADIVGVRWMSKLGYDPHAAVRMLIKFEASHPGSGTRLLSTHPKASDREERIQKLINEEKLMDITQKHGGPRLWTAGTPWGEAGMKSEATKLARQVARSISSKASTLMRTVGH